MLSLVYSSTARTEFTDGDLITLLMNSRANNRRVGLTGLLLYRDGRFLQVLEGEEEAVRRRYAIVAKDPRHRQIRILLEETIDERRFPRWTMGYETLTDPLIALIPGYDRFFDDPSSAAGLDDDARALIEAFRTDGVAATSA
ncbi:Blue light- and temperature-regulated antirepressor BluF [Frondihabitans sp. 762G35]|uniref:BLUF domain-containing protein n=1 Tax=Frondihabitans sp. 762G35 TaxID=1446794 RepID=UPI000D203BA3|nr:BLUF domain-containing protein [Frondihabitans sp. 762G35]ARC56228.1 Blue light- and temperature-regulated antirepressor BluF [Frondihabitans sp. 762G35]